MGTQIYERDTLRQVADKEFRGADLLQLVFSRDGSRFAAVVGRRIYVDENLQFWDSRTPSIVRIHETLTGRTLLAFPASSRWIRSLAFSPDGHRLATVDDDGTIEVRRLPDS